MGWERGWESYFKLDAYEFYWTCIVHAGEHICTTPLQPSHLTPSSPTPPFFPSSFSEQRHVGRHREPA